MRRGRYFLLAVLAVATAFIVPLGPAAVESAAAKRPPKPTVWVVFFGSSDCPHCARVKRLLTALTQTYPVKIKRFDIDRPDHYRLFERLEAVHGETEFKVPLVIVGDSILIGERRIGNDLEKRVRRYAGSGGAPLPYLGRKKRSKAEGRDPAAAPDERCACNEGRPPTIGEEWAKVRSFIDGLFSRLPTFK